MDKTQNPSVGNEGDAVERMERGEKARGKM
jgi:hypothetical protein